jgi:hypothetical protein
LIINSIGVTLMEFIYFWAEAVPDFIRVSQKFEFNWIG